MKLDRNINDNKRGKYALLKLRRLDEFTGPDDPFQHVAPKIADAIKTLEGAGILDWGRAGTEGEFFVLRLKDRYAAEALEGYANEAGKDDPEYADEVRELADRAGPKSPWCKTPD
jgi:hypothetical protein